MYICFYIGVTLRIFPRLEKKRWQPEKLADVKYTGKGKVMPDAVMRSWRSEIR